MANLTDSESVNPYESPQAGAEEIRRRRRRKRFWRSLLVGYAVHHGFAAFGYLLGMLSLPSEWERNFPPEALWNGLLPVVFVPFFDIYLIVEPLGAGEIIPPTYMALRWVRSAAVLTVFVAWIAYAIWRKPSLWWYLAIMSFLLALSLVVSDAIDHRTVVVH